VNGQFMWEFFKKYPYIIVLMGIPSSYLAMTASKIVFEDFGEKIWPMRIIGFSTGTIIFAFMAFVFMSEGLTLKTILSLILSIVIIIIQIAL
jgi:hypothetical protein